MTIRTTARPTTGAGPHPQEATVNDSDMHHLFDLIRDDKIRFTNWRHTDTAGNNIDDLVYAAEADGLVTVHPAGVIKPTQKGSDWRSHNHRPARADTAPLFQPAEPPPSPMPPTPRKPSSGPGEQNPNARLTEAQVRDIRARLAAGAPCKALATEYRVDPATISNIKSRKAWRHVA